MNYKPEKERAVDFIDKFEEIVRNYNKLWGIQTLPADEIRDAFYNAVVGSNNKIQSVDFEYIHSSSCASEMLACTSATRYH